MKYYTLRGHVSAVPSPTKKQIERWAKATQNKPQRLRANSKRQKAALDRMKAKWTKGDDNEHGPDQCTNHTDDDNPNAA